MILCIETATHLCSVAVCDGVRVLASRDEQDQERFTHAERLNTLVGEAMAEAGRSMRDIQAIAVGVGPGSYTGLRIGLSAAKGFCFALGLPIIGLSTLDILRSVLEVSDFALRATDVLHPMVDARRMEVFTNAVRRDGVATVMAPTILDAGWRDMLDPGSRHVVFGDGADKAPDLWNVEHLVHVPDIKPYAAGMALLAADRYERSAFDDLAYLTPLYGKEANLTSPGSR